MKQYLQAHKGKKLGVVREGQPKEVYFEAVVKEVGDDAVVFRTEDGKELAVPLSRIVMAGPPDAPGEEERRKPGFL